MRPAVAGWFVSNDRSLFIAGKLTTRDYKAFEGSIKCSLGKRLALKVELEPCIANRVVLVRL
jgi:hypothetical protein